jgi:hypothetical protein
MPPEAMPITTWMMASSGRVRRCFSGSALMGKAIRQAK